MITPRFTEHDTSLHLWLDDPKDPAVMSTRDQLVTHLRSRGFHVENDQSVNEIIRDGYHVGHKGSLEVDIKASGRSLEIKFFQNIVRNNPNGGRYDFNKRQKMPFLIGKMYDLERNKIATLMAGLGFPLTRKIQRHGMDEINFNRAEHDALQRRGRTIPELYNSVTATKGVVHDGDTVYFCHWNKRWHTGTAYHNINNMWWVLLPCGTVTNIASFEFHHAVPECGLKGRYSTESDWKRTAAD